MTNKKVSKKEVDYARFKKVLVQNYNEVLNKLQGSDEELLTLTATQVSLLHHYVQFLSAQVVDLKNELKQKNDRDDVLKMLFSGLKKS